MPRVWIIGNSRRFFRFQSAWISNPAFFDGSLLQREASQVFCALLCDFDRPAGVGLGVAAFELGAVGVGPGFEGNFAGLHVIAADGVSDGAVEEAGGGAVDVVGIGDGVEFEFVPKAIFKFPQPARGAFLVIDRANVGHPASGPDVGDGGGGEPEGGMSLRSLKQW